MDKLAVFLAGVATVIFVVAIVRIVKYCKQSLNDTIKGIARSAASSASREWLDGYGRHHVNNFVDAG